MRESGLGGTPRTSANGPLYLRKTAAVRDFPTHFSQYENNAALPPLRRRSSIDEAMEALFPDADGLMGAHLTQERAPVFGSADNARLYKGNGRFTPGTIRLQDQEDVRGAMQVELTAEVDRIRTRLTDVLLPAED